MHAADHPSLLFGTKLLVSYGERQTIVGVTDWGPYAGDRDLDLSQAAAKEVRLNAVDAEEVDVRVVANSVGYGSTTSKSHEGKDREGGRHTGKRHAPARMSLSQNFGHVVYTILEVIDQLPPIILAIYSSFIEPFKKRGGRTGGCH
jgi:rare lipoprotein A (peptidoglycan hydrolase)